MWPGFDGKPYTQDQWTAHVASIPADKLRWCRYITLHNTSSPTLAQWAESGPAHDARIRNLQDYYQNQLHWHAGPHAFISRSYINGFSDLTRPGVHASCFNPISIGLEMVGEFNIEDFKSGDGAKVAEMAVHAAAVLHNAIGIRPDAYFYGVRGLHFHIDCRRDNHDCPGTTARDRIGLTNRILARMAELKGPVVPRPDPSPVPIEPSPRVPVDAPKRMTDITATCFGGPGDRETSAYGGMINPVNLEVALPARMPSDHRTIRVICEGKSAVCRVNDVGPWNTNDAYWERPGGRPMSEEQHLDRKAAQNGRVPTNKAGIDLTPAVFEALGKRNAIAAGSMQVDWEFA